MCSLNGMLYDTVPGVTDFIRAYMCLFPFTVFAAEKPVCPRAAFEDSTEIVSEIKKS